jgi:hypothetical protein
MPRGTDIGMQQPMIISDHPATANVAVFVDDLTVLYSTLGTCSVLSVLGN